MTSKRKRTLSTVFSAAILLSTLVVAMVATSPASAVEPEAFKAVAAGDDHTCIVSAGEVLCAGKNAAGQAGQDRRAQPDVLTMTAVPGISNAVSVTAGEEHTCALLADKTARCWGKGNLGQLGDGLATNSSVPVVVRGLGDIEYLNAGDRHTCAIRTGGQAVCWGDNQYGQLGNGSVGTRTTASPVVGVENAVTISGGQTHTCAVRTTSKATCWGRNNNGQIGNGSSDFNPDTKHPPTTVVSLSGVSSIAAGWNHTCAVSNSNLFCWGHNESGQLGGGVDFNERTARPKRVQGISNVVQTSVGFKYTCALTSDGVASCLGDNTGGQIGNGQSGSNQPPNTVDLNQPDLYALPIDNVSAVAAGDQHTCVTNSAGLYCWGDNNDAQLGQGDTTRRTTPVGVAVNGVTPPPINGGPVDPGPVDPGPVDPDPGEGTVADLIAAPGFSDADADTLRLYNAFFQRDPDFAGAEYWLGLTRQGNDLSVLALNFAISQEFQNTYGTLSNAQYVERIYLNVLGRNFDQAGYDYWLGLLNSGQLDRGGVVRWVAANPEFKNANLYGGR